MAATLVSLSGFTRGISSDESGINIESLDVSSRPEFKDFVNGKDGLVRGFAVGDVMSEITISGEVLSTAGIMNIAIGTAFVPTNSVNNFGQSAGGCYPDSVSLTQSRDGFKKVSAQFTRNANVT